MLPNQKHPLHFHRRKEETFHIFQETRFNFSREKTYNVCGDLIDVKPGTWHEFYALHEVVFLKKYQLQVIR